MEKIADVVTLKNRNNRTHRYSDRIKVDDCQMQFVGHPQLYSWIEEKLK